MWNNLHIFPHLQIDGKIYYGSKLYKYKKWFPERDVHQISNVDIKVDNENRF
jgi:hypothetical protein